MLLKTVIVVLLITGITAQAKQDAGTATVDAQNQVKAWSTKVASYFGDADTKLIAVAIVIAYVAYYLVSPPFAFLGMAVYMLLDGTKVVHALPYWLFGLFMFNRNSNIAMLLFAAGFVYYSIN